jgi:hypothetical protein
MDKIVVSDKEVELAVVQWFNPQKRFGFALVCGKEPEQIFFHFGDGRKLSLDNNEESVIFLEAVASKNLEEPQISAYIIFIRTVGSKGRPKASPWAYLGDWITLNDVLREQNFVCDCGHKKKEHHADGTCGAPGCHCGDEAYMVAPGMETDGPREISTQDSTGGFSICQ